jgi:hypothetical protein
LEIEQKINRLLDCEKNYIIEWELNYGGTSHTFIENNHLSMQFFLGFSLLLLSILSVIGIKLIAENYGWIWGFFILSVYAVLLISEYNFFKYVIKARRNCRENLKDKGRLNLQERISNE